MSYIGTDDETMSQRSSRRAQIPTRYTSYNSSPPYTEERLHKSIMRQQHNKQVEEKPLIKDHHNAVTVEDERQTFNGNEDQWEANTCATGMTSEPSYSCEDLRKMKSMRYANTLFSLEQDKSKPKITVRMRCARYICLILACTIGFMSYLSPIIMVTLPAILSPAQHYLGNFTRPWHTSVCAPDCQGQLIALSIKMIILIIAIWVLFIRRSVADMPRLYVARSSLLAFLFFLTFAYWLFYGVRIVEQRIFDYSMIVTYSLSMVDTLLFVHYLAVVLLELRNLRPEYRIHIIRSPDGVSRSISVGALSMQQAAVQILQLYYTGEFGVYNPFLERLPSSSTARMRVKSNGSSVASGDAGFKLYDIDGSGSGNLHADVNTQAALMIAAARRRDSQHNERFYEELEWEKRVRKRKSRLVTATEDAFAHIRRLQQQNGSCVPMDANEAAYAVFPAFARQLQKYLKVTRQQPRHNSEQVVRHLSQCLMFDMTPKAFLERFLNNYPTIDSAQRQVKWSIVSKNLASATISNEQIFVLRCLTPGPDANVQLMCQVTKLPFFNLTEQPTDPRSDRFVLRLSSETSV